MVVPAGQLMDKSYYNLRGWDGIDKDTLEKIRNMMVRRVVYLATIRRPKRSGGFGTVFDRWHIVTFSEDGEEKGDDSEFNKSYKKKRAREFAREKKPSVLIIATRDDRFHRYETFGDVEKKKDSGYESDFFNGFFG